MLLAPGPLRVASRPCPSIFSCPLSSLHSLFPRSPLLLQKVLLSSSLRAKTYGVSRALCFHRSYRYSATTFNAAKSRFPTHQDLHRKSQPSNELIRYMRRWEDELRFDSKDVGLRWTSQQRDVMVAACIEFRLYYNPNKCWRLDRFEQALTAWRKGLQADVHTSQPRWNAAHRWKAERFMKREEKRRAAEEMASKMKSKYERNAQLRGVWKKVKFGALYFACGLLVLELLSFVPLVDSIMK